MQDSWTEILGDVTNMLTQFEKLEHKIAPQLAMIQNNSDNVDPKLMEMLNDEMAKLDLKRAELKRTKDNLKNMDI